MSLYARFAPRGPSGFGYGSTAVEVTEGLSLTGQNVLITGCNSGIGQEAMRVIAMRGAHVLGTARTLGKAEQACSGVSGRTSPLACELAEPASVLGCVEAVKKMDVPLAAIICNAGVMAPPELRKAHGYELQFVTNHIGHFMLVTGLLERLGPRGRVVVVSSSAHRQAPRGGIDFDNLDGSKGYGPWTAYGRSKFANLLFTKELARRLAGSERTANAVHPGVIRTNLQRHMNPLMAVTLGAFGPLVLKDVAQGAATEVYVATRPELLGVSGEYFARLQRRPAARRRRRPGTRPTAVGSLRTNRRPAAGWVRRGPGPSVRAGRYDRDQCRRWQPSYAGSMDVKATCLRVESRPLAGAEPWPRLTVACPRRGVIGLEVCIDCARLIDVELEPDTHEMVLVCQPEPLGPPRRSLRLVDAPANSPLVAEAPVSVLLPPQTLCLGADLGVREVATLLVCRGIPHAPVVDENARPLGVLVTSDIERPSWPNGAEPERVREVMRPVGSCLPDTTSIVDAATAVAKSGADYVTLTSASGTATGVLSARAVRDAFTRVAPCSAATSP